MLTVLIRDRKEEDTGEEARKWRQRVEQGSLTCANEWLEPPEA